MLKTAANFRRVAYPLVAFLSLALCAAFFIQLGSYYKLDYDLENNDIAQAEQRAIASPSLNLHRDLQHKTTDQLIGLFTATLDEHIYDYRSLIDLSTIWNTRGEHSRAEAALKLASKLRSSDPYVQMQAARFYLARDDLTTAFSYWTQAMAMTAKFDDSLYPVMMQMAADPRGLDLITQYLDQSASDWWSRFLVYTMSHAKDDVLVQRLFTTTRKKSLALSARVETLYVDYLIREGLILDGYMAWLNGLNEQQRKGLGRIYNASFDQANLNAGFGWRTIKNPAFEIAFMPTYGIEGPSAVKLLFRNKPIKFWHFYQLLILQPGAYKLTGRVREDGLQAVRGLQWQLRCKDKGTAKSIGKSEPFSGRSPWHSFAFDVKVPSEGCGLQELRLESASGQQMDFAMRGAIWFDALKIENVE